MSKDTFRIGLASVLALLCSSFPKGNAGEVSEATNVVGDANCFGELQFTSHLGSVNFSGSETYPFYFQYSSFREFHSPHLGQGFFVPLLEATLTNHDYFLEARTLGGGTIYLYRLPADPDRYLSLNGKHEVKKLGEDLFLRRTEDGFEVKYRRGRMEEVITPSGARLVYTYDGDICQSIRSSTGSMVVTFSEVADGKAILGTARGKFGLTFQEHPDSSDADYRPSGTPPIQTLSSIIWPDRKTTTFEYPEAVDSRQQRMVMTYDGVSMEAVWDRQNGFLRHCDGVDYQISPLQREVDYEAEKRSTGVYTIKRTYADKSWDSFRHDEDGGFSEYRDSSGTATRTHYINTRGPTFNLIRKREVLRGTQYFPEKPEVVYEAFYDTEGNLIRQVSDGRVIWHLRPRGLPPSTVGEEDDFYQYDDQGRIRFSRIEGTKTTTEWLKNGSRRVVSIYPWGEAFLRYYDKNGNYQLVPPSEKFPERSQL